MSRQFSQKQTFLLHIEKSETCFTFFTVFLLKNFLYGHSIGFFLTVFTQESPKKFAQYSISARKLCKEQRKFACFWI